MTEQTNTQTWAILELMGHDRTAGRYSFENGLHRVDVPQEDGSFNTEMIGSSAIFRLRFVDEPAAHLAARSIRPEPIGVWELRKELLRLAEPERSAGQVEAQGRLKFLDDPEYDDPRDRMDDDEYDKL